MPSLVRITTVPISLKLLITGQMKYMSEKGIDVKMMSADGPEIEEVVAREGCPHEIIPLTRKITPFADAKAIWILYRKLKSSKPDIIHTHTPKAGLVGMIAGKLAGVPVRLHTVAGLPLEASSGLKKKVLIAVEKLTYACAHEVWPNSYSLETFIINHKLAKPEKLNVIGKGSSNGIDTSDFNGEKLEAKKLQQIKEQIHYNADNKYLLFVGRIVKDKGIQELVEAFTSLWENHSKLKLILVGPGESHLDPLPEKTAGIIENNDNIITTGFSDFVKYYMHLSDLFIFPSHREGFPNSPMQAALMGCPVIASKINGNIDIVDDGINGLLFEKGNTEELTEKVNFALKNKSQMKAMNDKLQEKIILYFDRNKIQQEIFESYMTLLNKKKSDLK